MTLKLFVVSRHEVVYRWDMGKSALFAVAAVLSAWLGSGGFLECRADQFSVPVQPGWNLVTVPYIVGPTNLWEPNNSVNNGTFFSGLDYYGTFSNGSQVSIWNCEGLFTSPIT